MRSKGGRQTAGGIVVAGEGRASRAAGCEVIDLLGDPTCRPMRGACVCSQGPNFRRMECRSSGSDNARAQPGTLKQLAGSCNIGRRQWLFPAQGKTALNLLVLLDCSGVGYELFSITPNSHDRGC